MNDLRYAFRQLLKNPGFTVVAVLTLALSIGSATSVFSLFNAVLLRSLPVPNPQELRVLKWSGTEPRVPSLVGHTVDDGQRRVAECFSPATVPELRKEAATVAEVFAFASADDFAVQIGQETITANGMTVSDNFFAGLGVRPLLGRTFVPGPPDADAAQGVVISWDWWQLHFGGSAAALGRPLTLKGQVFTVIGVLPPEFHGVQAGKPTDFFVLLVPGSPLLDRPLTEVSHWWLQLMARVRPGVGERQLNAVLTGIFAREAAKLMTDPQVVVEVGRGGVSFERPSYRKPLYLMLGIVGLVMLVACANLAGLMLARNASRQHELAIRTALGASVWQRVRQSLVESLVLSVTGGGLGIVISIWGRAAVTQLLVGTVDGLRHDLFFDLTVLSFSFGAVFITAILFGALPVLLAGRVDPNAALKERGALRLSRLRSGRLLVISQLSISLLLLSGAGLYVRTVINLRQVDVGFNTDKLLTFLVRPMDAGYKGESLRRYYARVLESLAALPGVQGVALIHYPLLGEQDSMGGFTLSGLPGSPEAGLQTHRLIVSDSFFVTLGIPLVQGGAWQSGDTNGIVLNEAFVKRFIPGQSPIGQILKIWGVAWHVTGVCRDLKHSNIKQATPPTVYFSFLGRPPPATSFAVRTLAPPTALADPIRRAITRVDPGVPATNLATQEQVLNRTIGPERLFAMLGAILGGFALLLSCLGLYGLMAYDVNRRRGEIAIRMAIGAQRSEVAASVLREAFGLTIIGGGLGIPLVFFATRLFRAQLYGVEAYDPLTLAVVMTVLALVTLGSAWLPAWRAARLDPLLALRSE